jgi:Rieske Fe-S protein
VTTPGLSRRNALAGVATVGIGLPLLAACGGGDTETASDPSATPSSGGSPSGDPGSSSALAAESDIPVGGGTIFADEKVVVTQPAAGEFKAFSATCTHQGCLVASVSDGTINCTCHGSKFSIEDGSVAGGPASAALGAVELNVADGEISLA